MALELEQNKPVAPAAAVRGCAKETTLAEKTMEIASGTFALFAQRPAGPAMTISRLRYCAPAYGPAR